MKLLVRFSLAILVCSLLSACVSAPRRQAFNPQSRTAVKSIDVLPMRHAQIELVIVNNPALSFGLIGLGIAEANRKPKANWLRSQVNERRFDPVATFRDAFTAAMAGRGYELRFEEPVMEPRSASTRRTAWGSRRSYDGIESKADALLDVNFGFIGYAAAGTGDGSPYRPTVVVTARLVSPDGRRVLFEDQIVYNAVFPKSDRAVTLNPDERFRYPDFDDLKAAGPVVVDGLDIAFREAARTLAEQL